MHTISKYSAAYFFHAVLNKLLEKEKGKQVIHKVKHLFLESIIQEQFKKHEKCNMLETMLKAKQICIFRVL